MTPCPHWRLFGAMPAALDGSQSQGWPVQQLTGEPPAGSGVACGPSQFLTLGAPAAQNWAAGAPGALGFQAPHFIGFFDRLPWEGRPDDHAEMWQQNAQSANGEGLTLRVQLAAGTVVRTPQSHAGIGVLREACVSVVIAAFDAPGQTLAVAARDTQEGPTAPGGTVWLPNRVARMGPNIASELMFHGHAEVDLDAWAGGARFIAAWLWVYWVGVQTPSATQDVVLTTWQRPPKAVRPATISIPIDLLNDGPIDLTSDTDLVCIFGGWPGLTPAHMRIGCVNGGANAISVHARSLVGPHPDPNIYTGPVDNFVCLASETQVRNAAVAREMINDSNVAIWATHQATIQNQGGPIILSAVGGGV